MTSPSPSSPHSTRHRICRIVLNPAVLLFIVLVYTVVLVLFRAADHGLGFVALRGSTEAIDASSEGVEREAAAWEPESPGPYGEMARGPVKGGVEIYPLQPNRRPRMATVPLVPEVAEIEGVLAAWKMPDVYTEGGGGAMKGLYILFHGCHHSHLDWFDLPEERTIVAFLVKMGYAVLAPASQDRVSGCWRYNTEGGDIDPVKTMLWRWYRDWSIPPNTPLFLLGVSSGGDMATVLATRGGFQLCEKKTTYVQVSGVLSQVSWGVGPVNYGAGCPPLAFMPMQKGEPIESGDAHNKVPQVFGNSRKIPPQITSIAHYVRKSGGRPRMLLLPIGELSLYRAFFSDRVYEITVEQSARLHAALVAARTIKCDPSQMIEGEKECFLKVNPRDAPLALDTLVATYEAILDGATGKGHVPNGTVAVPSMVLTGKSRGVEKNSGAEALSSLPILRPSSETDRDDSSVKSTFGEDVARRVLTKAQSVEVFRELLNVAWGAHEISAEFVGLWEKWLWDSCGDNCRPGPW